MTVRVPLAREFSKDGLRRFVETSDAQARRIIRTFDRQDPAFYEALNELCTVAQGVLAQAKVFVGKQDVTPPR
jgi:hypothetical protein